MSDVQDQIYATIKPFQEVALKSAKSFTEVATVTNDLIFDLTQRNIRFSLDLYAASEKVLLDTVKLQQQYATTALQFFQSYATKYPLFPGYPTTR